MKKANVTLKIPKQLYKRMKIDYIDKEIQMSLHDYLLSCLYRGLGYNIIDISNYVEEKEDDSEITGKYGKY